MSTATLNGTVPSLFAGIASAGGGGDKYDLCPAGNHPGYLVSIFDLGTHDDSYNGEPKPDQRSIFLAWELPTVNKPNGEPFVMGETYTVFVKNGRFDFGEKNGLRKMMEGWRGKKYGDKDPIDPSALLGRSCLVNVIHKKTKKGNDIAVIEGVSAFPQGMQPPARRHDLVTYHVSMGEPPAIHWLPKIYFRQSGNMEVIENVVNASKERTGRPIGDGRPKDSPHSEAIRPTPAATPGEIAADDDIPF